MIKKRVIFLLVFVQLSRRRLFFVSFANFFISFLASGVHALLNITPFIFKPGLCWPPHWRGCGIGVASAGEDAALEWTLPSGVSGAPTKRFRNPWFCWLGIPFCQKTNGATDKQPLLSPGSFPKHGRILAGRVGQGSKN